MKRNVDLSYVNRTVQYCDDLWFVSQEITIKIYDVETKIYIYICVCVCVCVCVYCRYR